MPKHLSNALPILVPAMVLTLMLALTCSSALAHTLYMSVSDNDDGTVTVEGIYSTGSMAARTEVRLEAEADGKVLFTGKTDEFGALTFDKPDAPYVIVLDGGPGHVATETGP